MLKQRVNTPAQATDRPSRATSIASVVERLLGRKSWQGPVTCARIQQQWVEIVGPVNAQHTRPELLTRGLLYVTCDHDTWRTELQYLKPEMLKRIAEVVGEGAVKDVFLK